MINIQHLTFPVWLISLSTVPSRFIHIVVNRNISFFFFYIWVGFYSYGYHIFFIHSSIDGYLGCFQILAIVHNVNNHININTGVHVAVQSLSHVRLCNPMNCSMPGFPLLHWISEFAQTHVHWVSDAIQPYFSFFCSCPQLVFKKLINFNFIHTGHHCTLSTGSIFNSIS